MPTLIKTQCPACQAYVSLPQSQLNELDAKTRCERCQQIFLINENLIVSGNDYSMTDETLSSSKLTKKNTALQDDEETLIYDDMPTDSLEETPVEYGSLDEMNVWFSELDTTSIVSTPKYSDQTISEPTTVIDNHTTTKNDINASIDNTNKHNDSDNAWLEKLLEEKNNVTETAVPNTDLSQLLTSMGVSPREQNQLSPRQVSRISSRSYPVQTRAQNSAALILWIIGCLVLIMLLFAQYVIFNLNTLVKTPEHAAQLQEVCAVAACSLPSANLMAFNITNLVYESSKIKAANTFSDIKASLKNQSTEAQLLPSLKVSVYDDNAVIGEFIALPKDYLASKQNSLPAEQNKAFMFTIPVASNQISRVAIEPIY